MAQTFYITTPIYYVNDVPHIGHAYTTIAADVLARVRRLNGYDVYFLTGLDEHGQKVQQAAAKANIAPQIHCDRLTPQFRNLWEKLSISNNGFIRTTDRSHQTVVQEFLQKLYDKDLIYRDEYTGWYCTFDERFWTEKDVEGGLCPDCRRPVEQLSESNYFFRMSQYQENLRTHIQKHPNFIQPVSRRNEVLGFLEKPLEDLSISRPKSRLSWGIELPFDTDYVTYVWFDALTNYISALDYLPSTPSRDRYWPASLHLVGKDILTTHAVYWSTMLMALGLDLPQTIFAHGWWTVDGEKMSKSRGNVVDPNVMVDKFGVDAFRFFLMFEVPFGQDGDFSQTALTQRYNSYLANGLGNLLSRTLTLLERNRQGRIPQPSEPANGSLEKAIETSAEELFSKIQDALFNKDQTANPAFKDALLTIWSFITLVDRYIDQTQPWALAKSEDGQAKLDTVLYTAAEALRFVCVALSPFIPRTAEAMNVQLGQPVNLNKPLLKQDVEWGGLQPGTQISKGKSLFPRIGGKTQTKEGSNVTERPTTGTNDPSSPPQSIPAATTPSPASATHKEESVEHISIEEFMKIRLKVGKILQAERVPKSNKLLKLKVDLGQEQRQIVAGIGKKYEPDQVIGQTIVVVANLKPAKLMGIESQGMVLAAGGKEVLALLTLAEDTPPGSPIK